MPDRIDVMISSTREDLRPHRAQAKAAIEQSGMHALVMENLPSSPHDAITDSLRLVDEAEIYLGIFGHRYGSMLDDPRNPDRRSITELEYRRAVERGIPRLIFLMDPAHPVTADMLESAGESLDKLNRLKEELKKASVVAFFKSPEDLRACVLHALDAFKDPIRLRWMPAPPPDPGTLPDPQPLPPGSRMTLGRSEFFTGRETDLAALARALLHTGDGAKVVITPAAAATGAGGIGKTQLAIEFAHRYGRCFYGVHWIDLFGARDADVPGRFEAEVAACGREMGLPGFPAEQPDQARATLAAWAQSPPRLVILDNAEDPRVVQAVLPRLAGARLLVTSRWAEGGDWRALGVTPCDLDVLTRPQSRALLRKLAPHLESAPDGDLDRLADRLGDFPLALDLAGRYLDDMRRVGLGIPDFLGKMDQLGSVLDHPALVDWARRAGHPTQYERGVAATFLLSWERVDDPLARGLFRACGYLAPNAPIPPDLLRRLAGVGDTPENQLRQLLAQNQEAADLLRQVSGDEQAFAALVSLFGIDDNPGAADMLRRVLNAPEVSAPTDDALALALRQLVQYGLLRADPDTGALAIHPLLADFARGTPPPGPLPNQVGEGDARPEGAPGGEVLPRAADALARLSTQANDAGLPAVFAPLRPHVEIVAHRAEAAGLEDAGALWNNLGYHLRMVADFAAARAAYERALRIWEQVLGADHPNVATLVNNLGGVLHDLGDLPAARAAYERALRIDEAAYGPDHPNVAIRVNNLGSVLKALGDLPAARAACERALRIFERVLPPTHPYIQDLRAKLAALGGGAPPPPGGEGEIDALLQAILAFVQTPDWDAAQVQVERHAGVLLAPPVDAVFGALIDNAPNDQIREMFTMHRAVLALCRAHGIAEAFRLVKGGGAPGA